MASAQLSSPRRAGAGSDLKETAPAAPGSLLGSSVRCAGPRRRPRLARAVPPRSTHARVQPGRPASCARAQACHPRPRPTRGGARAGRERPPAQPPRAHLPGPGSSTAAVPGPESQSRAGAGLRATQRFRPSWGPGAQGSPLTRLLAGGQAQGACPQPYRTSKESQSAFPVSRSPGRGFQEDELPAGSGARPGPAPSKGRGGPPAPAAWQGPSERWGTRASPCAEGPRSASPPPVRSCRRGPPPRPPRPGVTLRPRGLRGLPPGSSLGSGRRHAQAEAQDRARRLRARLTLGPSRKETSGSGRPQGPGDLENGDVPGGRAQEGPRTAGEGGTATHWKPWGGSVTRPPSASGLCRALGVTLPVGRGGRASKGSAPRPPPDCEAAHKGDWTGFGWIFQAQRRELRTFSAETRKPSGPPEVWGD